MHDVEKVAESAIGGLVISRMHVQQNAFPAGVSIRDNCHAVAKTFTKKSKLAELHKHCKTANVAEVAMQKKINETRIAADVDEMGVVLRVGRGLISYQDANAGHPWDKYDEEKLEELAQVQSVLGAVASITTVVQNETDFNGAFFPVYKCVLAANLRSSKRDVIDVKSIGLTLPLATKVVDAADMTDTARMVQDRACAEFDRRFCGERGMDRVDAPIVNSDTERIQTLLDLRLLSCNHFPGGKTYVERYSSS
jgi:hypothetical protein